LATLASIVAETGASCGFVVVVVDVVDVVVVESPCDNKETRPDFERNKVESAALIGATRATKATTAERSLKKFGIFFAKKMQHGKPGNGKTRKNRQIHNWEHKIDMVGPANTF
jgi:hypothetical protein